MTWVYRIYYIEDTEPMPERSDFCVFAKDARHAKVLADKLMGDDFSVIKVMRTYKPSNVLNLELAK